MKIRITGTEFECKQMINYFNSLAGTKNIKSVSTSSLYANRNSYNVYRLYVDIEYEKEELTKLSNQQLKK